MADLRDIFSLRALTLRQQRTLRRATDRAAPLFAAMLEDDPDGLRLAEHPLADLPAAEQLAKASSEDVLAIAVAAQGHLRRIPLNDTFRALSLKPPRAYGVLFASIRILEVSSVAGLPFDLEDTKLLCAISLNAVKVEGAGDATIRHGDEWPKFAAQMIKGRLLATERLDLFDMAVSAAEILDGGLYDGDLASQIVRMGQRLRRVKSPTYEVGEMHTRIQRLLAKPTSLLRAELR